VELTVLGCSGSYGAPEGGACSGYLVTHGDTRVWVDCGNGTFARLQQHCDPDTLDALVITHAHPDHFVDVYGLHVHYHYGSGRRHLPVYLPDDLPELLGVFVHDWGFAFDWHPIDPTAVYKVGELRLAFSRTDHPPPTFAVEVTDPDGRRLVYTADTGPGWEPSAFAPGADVVLSEATYLHERRGSPLHLSSRQAGEAARRAGAARLVLTHRWPTVERDRWAAEGAEAFGAPVVVAVPDLCLEV
jgi:ribonuclease BN (tRNA processing enzyme)